MNETLKLLGINDNEFIRGKVPMTKEEIRILSISKMNIDENSVIMDIGAGTGSVSIECALIAKRGKVFAYEKKAEAIELIYKNKEKFSCNNIEVIEGTAPESIVMKNKIDAAFIGGSSGNIASIIEKVFSLLKEKRKIVINATLIDTFTESLKSLNQCGYKNIDYCQVIINRGKKLGGKNSFEPLNPIFIIWGEK